MRPVLIVEDHPLVAEATGKLWPAMAYPVVVIPVSMQHYMMLKRNLIYTGITRGKRLVVLVGQKRALAMAVKGKQVDRRWSKLKEWLQ